MDEAIQRFIEIANIESRDIAQYYLSVSNGDIQAAVEMLFEDGGASSQKSAVEESSSEAGIVIDEENPKITVLEWNIQGLMDECLSERTKAIGEIIKQEKPTVVLMQEVILETHLYFKSALKPNYVGFSPIESSAPHADYFTAIFVDKTIFKSSIAKVIPLPDSKQGRQILTVEGRCYDRDVCVMSAHLESTRGGEGERRRQLVMLYNAMTQVPQSRTVIFGGDTNLRDFEFDSAVENGQFDLKVVKDVWVMLGSSKDLRYSWDLQANDNQIKGGTAKLRFERMFIRVSGIHKHNDQYFKPTDLKLIGKDRLPCGKFASDHWGMLASFSV